MNTTPNTTAAWRDHADQLIQCQIAWIADFEDRYPANLDAGPKRGDVLLDYARDHAVGCAPGGPLGATAPGAGPASSTVPNGPSAYLTEPEAPTEPT